MLIGGIAVARTKTDPVVDDCRLSVAPAQH